MPFYLLMMTTDETKSKVIQGKRKILTVLEHLLDHSVNEEELIDLCKYLSKSSYEDLNVERSLINLCGYPLCKDQIGLPPKQTYKISSQDNKVYDLTERKLFCSNRCFKSSLFLKQQLEDEPFWMKTDTQFDQIKRVQIFKEHTELKGIEVKLRDYPTDEEKTKVIEKPTVERGSCKRHKETEINKTKPNQLQNPYLRADQIDQLKSSLKNLTIVEKNISNDQFNI